MNFLKRIFGKINILSPSQAKPAASSAPRHSMSKGTILFVDNDRDFLSTRSDLLARAGYRVLQTGEDVDRRDLSLVELEIISS
jgi:hypothetical protein